MVNAAPNPMTDPIRVRKFQPGAGQFAARDRPEPLWELAAEMAEEQAMTDLAAVVTAAVNGFDWEGVTNGEEARALAEQAVYAAMPELGLIERQDARERILACQCHQTDWNERIQVRECPQHGDDNARYFGRTHAQDADPDWEDPDEELGDEFVAGAADLWPIDCTSPTA